ncbi:MAG: site-specific integrase [Proteobacteria bacterium]|nr:site-specific integrase [Pseudomonadota bacterium]
MRKINNKVYVDFYYLDERIREPSGLIWNQTNMKIVRAQLDSITVAIDKGTFNFATVFPKSKKAVYFSQRESMLPGRDLQPDNVLFKDYAWEWYQILKDSRRVTERTLLGYKSHLTLYLVPFFGERSFDGINAGVLDEFVSWARRQRFKNKTISNKTINKCMVPLKMICKRASIRYNWGRMYDPFFAYTKLGEEDHTAQVNPFDIKEQKLIISVLPKHWKPYFQFAFCSGLRQGEQMALKLKDIDWSKNTIQISRAMTLDEQGLRVEGKTKNKYSRRTLQLLPVMKEALLKQKKICEMLESKYLFCTTTGEQLNHANLSNRVWRPALKNADIQYRPMIQTRHSFATTALSLGENPLWIAHIMGHRDTDMIIKVYTKYLKNAVNNHDGKALNQIYSDAISSHE